MPYWRDPGVGLGLGLIMDTFETAITWVVPANASVPGRPCALFHFGSTGQRRRQRGQRTGRVARHQTGSECRRYPAWRHQYPPPRRRARPPQRLRARGARAVSPDAGGGQGRGRPARHHEPRRADRPCWAQRMACTPEDVAEAIVWLVCGAKAVTGEVMLLDSGVHLGSAQR